MRQFLAAMVIIVGLSALCGADVVVLSPDPGTTDVAANAVVSVTFDEAMDPGSFTEKTFRLQKTKKPVSDKWIEGAVGYDTQTHTAFFQPYSALEEGEYLAIVKNQVKNECGARVGKKHLRWTFTVAHASLVSIVIAPPLRILVTDSAQLSVLGTYEDGTVRDIAGRVRWSVSDTAAATVDAAGVLTALKVGTVVIRATDPATGIVSNDLNIFISNKVMRVDLAPASLELSPGGTAALEVKAFYYDDTLQDVTSKADFVVGDPQIVAVDDQGRLTALRSGTTTVFARVEDVKSNAMTVTVVSP